MTSENFQVDLRGIVEILSSHLYSSPRVYVRELIQNARDAIIASRDCPVTPPDGHAPIELLVDEAARTLIVRDYGVGLTEADARELLSTIGASSKREQIVQSRRDYLGQFGIGLLSCFLVADEIVVRSRSARSVDAATMRWVGHGDGTFAVSADHEPLATPGTEVRVQARVDEVAWVSVERVTLLARQFARLLDVPITVARRGEAGSLISTQQAPWEVSGPDADAWCEAELGFEPLTTIPFEVPMVGLKGVAFVYPSERTRTQRTGDVVFSHGMFVEDNNDQIVPAWARFVRVALDSGELPLTASRESLQETALLGTAREGVSQQLRAGIERIAAEGGEVFERFVEAHGYSLLQVAAEDPSILDFVAHHVFWETSLGSLRLVEMPAEVTYATTKDAFGSSAPLAAARGRVLINGSFVGAARALAAYDAAQTRMRLTEFRHRSLLDELGEPNAADAPLAARISTLAQSVLDEAGTAVEVRDFLPSSTLALLLPGNPVAEVESAPDDPWGAMLAPSAPVVDPRPKLVLNLRADAVRSLDRLSRPELQADTIRALHLFALLQAGIRLTMREQADLASALQALVTAATASAGEVRA